VFVRPRRYATIRTRLDLEAVREQLSGLATSERPEGWQGFMAHGWFLNGRLESDALAIDYHYNAPKNPQTYAVRGSVSETPDWRYVRLRIDAHAPWMDWWMLLALGGFAALQLVGPGRWPAVVGTVGLVLAVYAGANLVYIPSVVRDRVASAFATELRGSVREGPRWIVPK
jgi:hypothetical protein